MAEQSKQILVERARELRRHQTPAEAKLWRLLRSRRLVGYKFKRQHIIDSFIVDFYCAEALLALELDGDVHLPAHQAMRDERRQRALNEMGIEVMRFWNNQMFDAGDDVVEHVLAKLKVRCSAPLGLSKGLS